MIDQHQRFELFDNGIFERVVLSPPFKLPACMPNEACLYYTVKGDSHFRTPTNSIRILAKEAKVLKWVNYFIALISTNQSQLWTYLI